MCAHGEQGRLDHFRNLGETLAAGAALAGQPHRCCAAALSAHQVRVLVGGDQAKVVLNALAISDAMMSKYCDAERSVESLMRTIIWKSS